MARALFLSGVDGLVWDWVRRWFLRSPASCLPARGRQGRVGGNGDVVCCWRGVALRLCASSWHLLSACRIRSMLLLSFALSSALSCWQRAIANGGSAYLLRGNTVNVPTWLTGGVNSDGAVAGVHHHWLRIAAAAQTDLVSLHLRGGRCVPRARMSLRISFAALLCVCSL